MVLLEQQRGGRVGDNRFGVRGLPRGSEGGNGGVRPGKQHGEGCCNNSEYLGGQR